MARFARAAPRHIGRPGTLPVLRVVRPLAPEPAHQHEPVSPTAGGAVLRRRAYQLPRRLDAPATGRPTVRLSHGQRGSVSPAAPDLTDGGDACGAPTLTSRGLSHSGTASAKGGAAGASADADGSRGLPQSLGAIVHGGGAWAPSLRRGLPVRAASYASRRRGGGRCHEERRCLAWGLVPAICSSVVS
jgi:hypothetical protein